MKVTTCTDQKECAEIIGELNIASAFVPTAPERICDCIVQLAAGLWVVGSNNHGIYTLHLLEDADSNAAWDFFHNLRGPNTQYIKPRISVLGPSVHNPANN